MSTALAIAGVTQMLRDLLNDELVNANVAGVVGQSVNVTTLPPDRVVPESGPEASQLNVFLRHVTPNIGWRNEALPSRDGAGRTRLSNPPLALDLHYLISAYGAEPLHAEILLGYAMQLLHENPAIPRDALRTALQPSPDPGLVLPPALRALADSGLPDQVEQLRITPEYLNTEDMSKFWTATLSHYRPCAAYHVSVVLIQKQHPAPQPLPVLVRNISATQSVLPRVPFISAVKPTGKLPVAQLGKTVTLDGFHLDGTNRAVVLTNDRFNIEEPLPATGSGSTNLDFSIPAARAADFPAGVYRVGARVQPPGDSKVRITNQLALTLAPDISGLPITVSSSGTTASFALSFTPAARPGQEVRLVLGGSEYPPQPFTSPTTTLNFLITNAPLGDHLARLRIDGIDSPIIDFEERPPKFLNQTIRII